MCDKMATAQQDDAVARNAVLVQSAPVSAEAVPVKGIDFDNFKDRNITVAELLAGMGNAGFQASSVGHAVQIIDEMVSAE